MKKKSEKVRNDDASRESFYPAGYKSVCTASYYTPFNGRGVNEGECRVFAGLSAVADVLLRCLPLALLNVLLLGF